MFFSSINSCGTTEMPWGVSWIEDGRRSSEGCRSMVLLGFRTRDGDRVKRLRLSALSPVFTAPDWGFLRGSLLYAACGG